MILLLKGVYLILFHLLQTEIEVGKLGKHIFPAGTYVYVGSGMGGVTARVKRHLRGSQNKRWHIDYVLEEATEKEAIIYTTCDKNQECQLSKLVSSIADSQIVVHGLGSSDCECDTHLYLLNGHADAKNIILEGCQKSVLLSSDDAALDDESLITWQRYM